ncbi:SnoaL-like domain-containing protein [Nocardia nova SH22a]|uniref:SnoaL-like domain-containing protein n=1 Tax=Nocardia nova SH22a TaxID=1415166 RepID=W5TKF1_9NOCA|nr:nuclear transport factor 2 family protein [Nocardia nova]AHH19649.1 SnoaL-like domain-containing protein [Nocardia nova SH22a]
MTLPVADRLELSDLVHRYAAGVDARDIDSVVELFTGTARLVMPAPPDVLVPEIRHDGRAGVRAALAALDGVLRTQHAITGEVFTRTGADTATGSISGAAHHWIDKDDRITDVIWYLRYADSYARTEQGWRFAARALSIDAIETRPARQVRR